MAAKAQKSVGSAAWIAAEKENMMHLVNQEMEEVEYPVSHELEWLNEHMAEIFDNNQFNVTEIFKTPGKLRGKTPRTVRKRNPQETRLPLSDVFSVQKNHASPAKNNRFNNQIASIVAQNETKSQPSPQGKIPIPKFVVDSGYHGETDEDDMAVVPSQSENSTQPLHEPEPGREREHEPESEDVQMAEPAEEQSEPKKEQRISSSHARSSVDRRTTEQSFHSAQEMVRDGTVEPMAIECEEDVHDSPADATPKAVRHVNYTPEQSPLRPAQSTTAEKSTEFASDDQVADDALDHDLDDVGSPSDGSTPERPLVRKSSLTFASLPAREPLMTKKSMGGSRVSRTSHIEPKMNGANRASYLGGRQTGGTRLTQALPESTNEQPNLDDDMNINERPDAEQDETDAETKSKLHNKSSTQRLHEKINMLGQSQAPRPTKSISAVASLAASQVPYPDLSSAKQDSAVEKAQANKPGTSVDNSSERAKPVESSPNQRRNLPRSHTVTAVEELKNKDKKVADGEDYARSAPRSPRLLFDEKKPSSPIGRGLSKSVSTPAVPSSPSRFGRSPVAHQKTASAANAALESTTPPSSPRRYEGPLSASKLRLQSIMKSAKGLFSSSAGVSAAAKMETLSPTESRSQPTHPNLYPTLGGIFSQPETQQAVPDSPPRPEPRKTRSSTEREERRKEQELKERQRFEEQIEKDREQERQRIARAKAAQEKHMSERREQENSQETSQPKSTVRSKESSEEPNVAVAAAAAPPQRQAPKQSEIRRPVKPTRETTHKPKPQPVSIRVGTNSQRIPLASASFASAAHESNLESNSTSVPAPKQQGMVKKASSSSVQTASTNSFKSSTSSSSTQAKSKAILAAERKKEQEERDAQRKLELKRENERKRAAQEEARRQDQRSRAEAGRQERERSAAASSEDPRKLAQKQAIEKRRLENARKLEQQRAQQATPGNDLGSARPASRLGSVQPSSRTINIPPPNPAKPAKRPFEEESHARPAAPKQSIAYQQADNKRRKTDEMNNSEPPVRPTMAPPIRQSIRKETSKPPVFTHGYTTAPPPAAHHQAGPSLFKNGPYAPNQAHRAGPMEMAKYASGKIPFADGAQPSQKTPAHAAQKISKSSPNYPNGENIQLPEIATDSEDSDEEPYAVPEWAQQKNLDEILKVQEGQDADSIFGPVGPLNLEEMFKGNKERLKRFRDRTSSANWAGADGLTQEEIRKDLAERMRLRQNGGWTFNS